MIRRIQAPDSRRLAAFAGYRSPTFRAFRALVLNQHCAARPAARGCADLEVGVPVPASRASRRRSLRH